MSGGVAMSILRAVEFFASVKYAPADDGLVFLKPLGAYYYYVPVMSVKCHIQCSNVVVGVCSFFFAHVLQRCEKMSQYLRMREGPLKNPFTMLMETLFPSNMELTRSDPWKKKDFTTKLQFFTFRNFG